MTVDPRDLLLGHAAGTLSAEERAQLYRAALDDQALFDELVDEEPLRSLLADPAARGALLAAATGSAASRPALDSDVAPPQPLERRAVAADSRRRSPWPAGIGLAAGLLLASGAVYFLVGRGSSPLRVALAEGSATSAADLELSGTPDWIFDQPRGAGPAEAAISLVFDRESRSYRVGDAMRIALRVDRAAEVYVVHHGPGDVPRLLFPNTLQPSARVERGETLAIPPDGAGNLRVTGPPGRNRILVRAYAPGSVSAGWRELVASAELAFDVESPPGEQRLDEPRAKGARP